MQRTSEVLEDRAEVGERVDVTELIARFPVEHRDPAADAGRHRRRARPVPARPRRRSTAAVTVGVATVLVAAAVVLGLRAGTGDTDASLDRGAVGLAAPAPAAAPRPDEGVQAALVNGWTLVDRDEFAGAVDARWNRDDGVGRDGNGRRSPDAVNVRDGVAVIHGDAAGITGAMWWRDGRETGRWEMRARLSERSTQYRPALLLSPDDRGTGREITPVDLTRPDGAPVDGPQIDLTVWHNYAGEVTSDRVVGYVDGLKWFESTDRDTLPRGSVHPVIQLDWFPQGAPPEPAELLVDWMRVYE